MTPQTPRTAVVLSGGGERIVAWQIGVLAGLHDAGIDLRWAQTIVGTSAGALVAARLAIGDDPRAKADVLARRDYEPIPVPDHAPFEMFAEAFAAAGSVSAGRRRMGEAALSVTTAIGEQESIAVAAARVPEAEWPANLRLVAVDAQLGERFVIDKSAKVAPAVGVAASRAVPGMLPAITVAGRKLIDGAVGSATNADIVLHGPAPERVVVVSAFPTDARHPRLAELCRQALHRELEQLRVRGIEVVVIQANQADMDLMGPDPMNPAAAPLAVRTGRMRGRMAGRVLAADAPAYSVAV